jgi:hypothetical protein
VKAALLAPIIAQFLSEQTDKLFMSEKAHRRLMGEARQQCSGSYQLSRYNYTKTLLQDVVNIEIGVA